MKAMIIRPGALGDTLMLLPALVDLSQQTAITYVGRQPGLGVVEDYVDSAMDLEGHGWHRLFMEKPHGEGLPVSKTDLAIAFFGDKDGTIQRNLKVYLPDTTIHTFPSFPKKERNIHVAEYLSQCLASTGLPVDPDRSMKTILTEGLPQEITDPVIQDKMVFHPGSGDPEKNHPPDFWLNLISRLKAETELKRLKPLLLLGPAEKAVYPLFTKALSSTGVQFYFSPNKNLLTRILKEAELYLGQDSGITHLAAMLGTPTVALFNKSNPNQWRPLGPYVKVINEKKAGPGLTHKALEASRSLHRPRPTAHRPS